MQYSDDLFLYEEIMLLALKDEEGTIAAGTMYNYAVGGAIIAELILSQNIVINQSKRKKLVSVINSEPLNDSLIDEWLMKITSAKRPKTLQDWISRIANTRYLKDRVATQLCQRDILKMDEDKILLEGTRTLNLRIDSRNGAVSPSLVAERINGHNAFYSNNLSKSHSVSYHPNQSHKKCQVL